jgi:hypothetical protein
MTKDEAMKLACKALMDCHYYMINAGLPNQSLLNEAFTAYMELEAALAEQPAPVQHEMTPEMMRKVQMHSELGAYAASNLVGAYDLFQEFWRVAMSAAPQPAQQEQCDSICQEDDGCPTEKTVLQRFWRGQSIPDEHYPAWFKPVQQEPVAKKKHEPKIDLGKYAGTYGGYITPEPSEGYLQKAYRLANELRSHLSIAPAQRNQVLEEVAKKFDERDKDIGWYDPGEPAEIIRGMRK